MSSLRETKIRIRSVKNTEKITRAMKMVAASKLRRAQEAVLSPRPYEKKLKQLISGLARRLQSQGSAVHPLLKEREKKKNIELLVLTSDRGLCGALNSSVVRAALGFMGDAEDEIDNIFISTIGKKGHESLVRSGYEVRKYYQPKGKTFDFATCRSIGEELCERFINGEIDGVYLIFNEFGSAITQTVVTQQLLPVPQVELESEEDEIDYLYEPDKEKLLDQLVPKHFSTELYQAYLESFASEQGARMTAMDNATRNAKEMTEKLTLQYNRARQAAITKELMEIIGGAEAL